MIYEVLRCSFRALKLHLSDQTGICRIYAAAPYSKVLTSVVPLTTDVSLPKPHPHPICPTCVHQDARSRATPRAAVPPDHGSAIWFTGFAHTSHDPERGGGRSPNGHCDLLFSSMLISVFNVTSMVTRGVCRALPSGVL